MIKIVIILFVIGILIIIFADIRKYKELLNEGEILENEEIKSKSLDIKSETALLKAENADLSKEIDNLEKGD